MHLTSVPTRALLETCALDRKLLDSLEAVRAIRLSLLTSNFTRLRSICDSLEVTGVVDVAMDEVN